MSVPQSITLPSEMINNEESLRLNRFSRANPIFHLEASRGNSWSKMDRVMSPCCILICLGALYCIFFQEGSWTSKLLTFLSFFIHSFFVTLCVLLCFWQKRISSQQVITLKSTLRENLSTRCQWFADPSNESFFYPQFRCIILATVAAVGQITLAVVHLQWGCQSAVYLSCQYESMPICSRGCKTLWK